MLTFYLLDSVVTLLSHFGLSVKRVYIEGNVETQKITFSCIICSLSFGERRVISCESDHV